MNTIIQMDVSLIHRFKKGGCGQFGGKSTLFGNSRKRPLQHN